MCEWEKKERGRQLRRPRTGIAMHVPGSGGQSAGDGVLGGDFARCWAEVDASE